MAKTGADSELGERCSILDGEKRFEVPELTPEIMEQLAGYTPGGLSCERLSGDG